VTPVKMSRRRMEAGINNSSSFSLRECMMECNSSAQVVQTSHPQQHSTPSGNSGAPISFSLPMQVDGKPPTPSAPSTLSFKLNIPAGNTREATNHQVSQPKHAFGMPLNALKRNGLANPELMRLTAQSDDLRTRLKTATERSMFLEAQLQRIQKIAVKERSDFAKQLGLARTEIGTLKESENTMKGSIMQLKQAIEKKMSFEAAVKCSMENKQVAEAQAKVDDLSCKQTELMTHLHQLRMRCNEVESASDAANKSLGQIEATKQASVEENASIIMQGAFQKQRVHKIKSEIKALEAPKQASIEENASIIMQSAFQKQRVYKIKSEIKALEASKQASPTSQAPHLQVLGDEAPDIGLLLFPTDTSFRMVDELSCSANGLPYHFNLDAPISLTGNDTQLINSSETQNATTETMLAAIVGDLKAYLADASSENDKRGLNRGLQTGAANL